MRFWSWTPAAGAAGARAYWCARWRAAAHCVAPRCCGPSPRPAHRHNNGCVLTRWSAQRACRRAILSAPDASSSQPAACAPTATDISFEFPWSRPLPAALGSRGCHGRCSASLARGRLSTTQQPSQGAVPAWKASGAGQRLVQVRSRARTPALARLARSTAAAARGGVKVRARPASAPRVHAAAAAPCLEPGPRYGHRQQQAIGSERLGRVRLCVRGAWRWRPR